MVKHRPNKSGPVPQPCPLESSLKLLAGAWTPQILWYLQSEPRRFGDLKRDLGKVSAKVLTTRLRELEKKGVIARAVMHTSPPTVEYALTDLGKKMGPILTTIAEVGRDIQKQMALGKPDVPKVSNVKSENLSRVV
jgi:DNA-binding HxlR family transcriptional regulator